MSFTVTVREGSAGGRSGPVYTLADAAGRCRAEVWPQWGFNCLRWEVGGHPVLYTAPDWETNPVPTRSGHPTLFPFPGRLRGGRLVAGGGTGEADEGRARLARLYLAAGLSAEALGAVETRLAGRPELIDDGESRLVAGIARYSLGRLEEAAALS